MSPIVEGEGWDHVAWRVERPDGTWIVKQVKDGPSAEAAASVRREAAVMRLVGSALGSWVAAEPSATEDRLTYRRLEGTPLNDLVAAGMVDADTRQRLSRQLGGLIGQIGELDLGAVGESIPRDDGGWREWLGEWPAFVDRIADTIGPGVTDRLHAFAAAATAGDLPEDAQATELTFAHNDLGSEHVLVDPTTMTITGIIDWTDAAIADPAADVGRLLRDLGPTALDAVLDGLGVVGDRRTRLAARAWCYARLLIVEDLAYALDHRSDLVALERSRLVTLFDGTG